MSDGKEDGLPWWDGNGVFRGYATRGSAAPPGAPAGTAESLAIGEAVARAQAVRAAMRDLPSVESVIRRECSQLADLLASKNASYGNSVLDPVSVFSKASAAERICSRLDDKLSRLMRGNIAALPSETVDDTINDLLGYLILYKVARAFEEGAK